MSETVVETITSPLPDKTVIELFRATLRGDLLLRTDASYHEARKLWNGMIDKHPGMIVRCAGVSDVINSVNFARKHNLLVAVRGGGHNIAGKASCDDGMVIDLSRMKGIRVDPANRTARAEPGVLWREFDQETQAFGLATPGGVISSTGIAGFTLGGGLGWLTRRYGLTCDNLLSADVVNAEGRFVTASPRENSDLYWGLRGGGGNFGIVTSFEYRVHPVTTLVGGIVIYPFEKTREILRFYRDHAHKFPDELMAFVTFATAPPEHFVPKEFHGKTIVAFGACYDGPVNKGEKIIRPLRENFGRPIADLIGPVAYCDLQKLFDADFSPIGFQNYWKSDYLRDIDDTGIDTIVDFVSKKTSPMTGLDVIYLGGAFGRVGEEETAFSHRKSPYFFDIEARWSDHSENEKHIRWAREFWEAMRPHATGGVYVNFLMEEGDERVRAAYGPGKYERLVELKNKYDPTNFFRLNQNIKPSMT